MRGAVLRFPGRMPGSGAGIPEISSSCILGHCPDFAEIAVAATWTVDGTTVASAITSARRS
jgi:hypothetical protein